MGINKVKRLLTKLNHTKLGILRKLNSLSFYKTLGSFDYEYVVEQRLNQVDIIPNLDYEEGRGLTYYSDLLEMESELLIELDLAHEQCE